MFIYGSSIDSLFNELNKHNFEDSIRVNLLIKIGEKLLYSNPDSSILFTSKALELSEKIQWSRGTAGAYRQLGVSRLNKGDYVSAIDYFQSALTSLKQFPNKQFEASIYNNLGTVYSYIGEFDKAIDNYKKLLVNSRELNLKMEESVALMNIGFTYQRMNEDKKAMDYLSKSLKIAEDSSFEQVAAYALNNMAILYTRANDFREALIAFQKSIEYADKSNDMTIKASSIGGIAQTYFHSNDFYNAEKYCKMSLAMSIKSGALLYQSEIQLLLSDIYKEQKKFDKALEEYKTYIILRDSILNDEKKTEIAKKEMKFEFDKKDAISKSEISRQKLIKNFTFSGAAVLALAFVSIFSFYKRRRDAEKKRSISDFNALVSETEMKALRSQMNPHFIFNSLNSINDYILKNDIKSADLYLSKFSRLMRMILENSEKKEISIADDIKGLELYMQLESLRLKNKFSFEIVVDTEIDRENTLIPPLILQPFVENSIWHGLHNKDNGGKILIHIKKDGNMINCIVEDNGIGREESAKRNAIENSLERKSLGMKITNARIEILNKLKKSNAAVKLSDLSEGLRVEVKLPLELNF
jgi:tetratricopeptide (TPR) repeat protein